MPSAQDITLTPDQFRLMEEAIDSRPAPIVGRGAALMRERAVRSLAWIIPGLEIEAKVQGTRLYTTRLTFHEEEAHTDCSCEYGESCKHGVALMLELRKHAQTASEKLVVQRPEKPLDANSLAGLVVSLSGKKLSRQAVFFLNKAQSWWDNGTRLVDQPQLQEMCGRQSYWGYGKTELYPPELKPKTPAEFLAFLAEVVRRSQLTMPEPILAAVDPTVHKNLMAQWQRLKEIQNWRQSFERWGEPSSSEAQSVPNLRLQLLPGAALVQVKHPNESQYGKATQKLLKEYLPRYSYGEPKNALNAGSQLVLRAACDEHGTIRSTEIAAMAEPLCKSLTQLAGSEELFHEHVCGQDGEPLIFTHEMLRWELKAPTHKTGDYALRLLNENGITPPPPVAILSMNPLRYVTAELIYNVPYWPFGKSRMDWPVQIPAEAIESREGLTALAKLGVPVPERIADQVQVIKAKVDVRCQVHRRAASTSDYLQVSAKVNFGKTQAGSEWNGSAWQTEYPAPKLSPETSNAFVQIDKTIVSAATAWLKQMPMKPADNSGRRLWVEQRIVGKDWPDQFIAWLDRRPQEIAVELDTELASLKDGLVSGKVRLDVEESKTGMDWFDLSVALDVTDSTLSEEEIALLLKAKGKWVKLTGKGWRKLEFDLSEEQQKELAELGMAVNDFDGSKQKLHALQLGSLTQHSRLLPAERAAQVQRRIEEIQTRVTPELPATITATLRPYQLSGFHFLAYLTTNRFGGVLADDMGLGKTLQTLA